MILHVKYVLMPSDTMVMLDISSKCKHQMCQMSHIMICWKSMLEQLYQSFVNTGRTNAKTLVYAKQCTYF